MRSIKRWLSVLASLFVVASWLSVPMPVAAVGPSVSMTTCTGGTFCFQPNEVSVPTGGSVSWVNSTAVPHTATSDTVGGWDTGIVNGSSSAAVSFNTAGIYPYHCAIHTYMTGTVTVT